MALAACQPLIDLGFSLEARNISNFGPWTVGLDLPVPVRDPLGLKDDNKLAAHAHQYAAVRHGRLGRSSFLIFKLTHYPGLCPVAAKARGKKLGRQPGQRPSDRKAAKVLALARGGASYRQIARQVGLNKTTVGAIVKRDRE